MKKTSYVLGVLLTGVLGSFLVWYIGCCNCNKKSKSQITNTNTAKVDKNVQGYPFTIKDEKGIVDYTVQENFNFYKSGFKFITPISGGLNEGITHLKSYLMDNLMREVDVTGGYTSDEINDSPFPNLGIARANSVKNHLVSNGVDSHSINLKSELLDGVVIKDSVFVGPVSFHIHELNKDESESSKKELEAIHQHIMGDPLLLHFEFGDNTLHFNDTQRNKIKEIITYIDKSHDAVIDVIGHSDNVGSPESNTKLGLERAAFVKSYLVSIGVNTSQIKVDSKGPANPIATNDTEEGRAKNRRVEIILE